MEGETGGGGDREGETGRGDGRRGAVKEEGGGYREWKRAKG